MKKHYAIIMLVLATVVFVSLVANLYLFNQARRYYTDLNEVRLDPLGLNTYPPDTADTVNANLKVLFYGDSRAARWPASDGDTSWSFLNRGIEAQTSAQVRLRFQYQVAPLKPHVIVLQAGINDLKTIPLFPERKAAIIAACEDNIRHIVAAANDLGATVILTTIFPVGNVPLERQPFWSDDIKSAVDEANDFIRTLADKQIVILDSYSLLAGDDGLMQSRYSLDELHINAEGYKVLNTALLPILSTVTHSS